MHARVSLSPNWIDSTATFEFSLPTPDLREFIAFDGTGYHTVFPDGPVANQNLHATEPATLIIIVHPVFREKADILADFHRNETGISVTVAETDHVFNEFASGAPDLTGIRTSSAAIAVLRAVIPLRTLTIARTACAAI